MMNDDGTLYIFAGRPWKSGLNAGGLQHLIEVEENLGMLTHDLTVSYRKSGKYILTPTGEERLGDTNAVVSPLLERDGITWDWFPEHFTFGSGLIYHSTTAGPEFKILVKGSELGLEKYLVANPDSDLTQIKLEKVLQRTNGWVEWEQRWVPGTCPLENVKVHITWMSFQHALPPFAYNRLRDVIENEADTPGDYSSDMFSEVRAWSGNLIHQRVGTPSPY